MKRKIKRDDRVIVIAGKEKGKIGIVKKFFVKTNKVTVEGLNKVVCFNKKTKEGITRREAPMHISNVSHIDPVDEKAVRVKVVVESGIKKLISKRSNKEVRLVK